MQEPEYVDPTVRSVMCGYQGHLKEQDMLIDFIIDLHKTHTPTEVMAKVERWILEHRAHPKGSRLSQLVPTVGDFYTHLGLVRIPYSML